MSKAYGTAYYTRRYSYCYKVMTLDEFKASKGTVIGGTDMLEYARESFIRDVVVKQLTDKSAFFHVSTILAPYGMAICKDAGPLYRFGVPYKYRALRLEDVLCDYTLWKEENGRFKKLELNPSFNDMVREIFGNKKTKRED